MKLTIILLIILLAISLSAIETDKIAHFACSYIIYDIAYKLTASEDVAFVTSLSVGIGKEVYDLSNGGEFSDEDLLYDVAGILFAFVLNDRFILSLNKQKINIGVKF